MYQLKAQGMSCQPCARSVTASIKAIDPDADIRIDMVSKQITIASDLPMEDFRASIKQAGYETEVIE